MVALATRQRPQRLLRYSPRGASADVFGMRDGEIVVSGPAGTGKSLGILQKLHRQASKYDEARILILRKTRRSLTESAMVTYWNGVKPWYDGVEWHSSDQHYLYPNKSIIAVGGLDKSSKVMSTEWDVVYIQEATELTLKDWEDVTLRLRYGRLPYQQLLADCNPDSPTHWLKVRADEGKCLMLDSRHEDNPRLYNADGTITVEGERYIGILDKLTGVRYGRYRLGRWVAAEGTVYEDSFDRYRNIIDPFPIPDDWPRYLCFDFGYENPFVCLWAAMDPDGRLYIYREIYMSHVLVEDHAKKIKQVSRWGEKGGDPLPRSLIRDHDAEDGATLERHLGLRTIKAQKNVSTGIQLVQSRLRPSGDGKARLFYFRDCLVQRDRRLEEQKLPCSTVEEFDSYIWDRSNGANIGDKPVKKYDHGMDTTRYLVCNFDLIPSTVTYSNRIY